MNYFELHIGDYARDTNHLSLLEHGVYLRLLMRYYADQRGIAADQTYRLVGARTKDERAAVDSVVREFFYREEDVWKQKRCEHEIARVRDRIESARENGKKGGRPRGRTGDQKPNPSNSDNPSERVGFSVGSENKPSQNPDESSPIPNLQSPGLQRSQSPSIKKEQPSSFESDKSQTSAARSDPTSKDDQQNYAPSKSPRAESRKPKNALEFEDINDRVWKFIEALSSSGPVNHHDYRTLAKQLQLSEKQIRTSVRQLLDRGRLPITPRVIVQRVPAS